MDIESLERRNDSSISLLEGKTAMLKSITAGIQGEVRQQHDILDQIGRGVEGVKVGLGGTVTKIQRVMEGPRGRQYMLGMLGGGVILFILSKIL